MTSSAVKVDMPPNNYIPLVNEGKLLPLEQYDHVIVSYSGGKDSLAMLLHLLEMGVPKSKIELWHQHIDGAPGSQGLMDWPCTEGYVRATAEAMGLTLRWQWKDGGFEGEMLRENSNTKGVYFEDGNGETQYLAPSSRGKLATRRLFPQTSADLSVRWCSAYLKIDVARRAIANDPRFKDAKILFVTGERREESTARSKYNEVEGHACHNKKRTVHQWRNVIDWSEHNVWSIIERWNINPHPAYRLGFARVSCMACIFGNADQWASVRQLDSQRFDRIANYEGEFGKTIKRGLSVIDQANTGCAFAGLADREIVELALSRDYPADKFFVPEGQTWHLPVGAYKRQSGPS